MWLAFAFSWSKSVSSLLCNSQWCITHLSVRLTLASAVSCNEGITMWYHCTLPFPRPSPSQIGITSWDSTRRMPWQTHIVPSTLMPLIQKASAYLLLKSYLIVCPIGTVSSNSAASLPMNTWKSRNVRGALVSSGSAVTVRSKRKMCWSGWPNIRCEPSWLDTYCCLNTLSLLAFTNK